MKKRPKLLPDLDEQEEFEGRFIPVLQPESDNYSRYLMISGSTYSIVLASDDYGEDIDYLSKKALHLIKQIKKING